MRPSGGRQHLRYSAPAATAAQIRPPKRKKEQPEPAVLI